MPITLTVSWHHGIGQDGESDPFLGADPFWSKGKFLWKICYGRLYLESEMKEHLTASVDTGGHVLIHQEW